MASCSLIAATLCYSLTHPVSYVKAEKWEPEAVIVMAARHHNVPESMALAVAETESKFNCDAVGKAGEIGLFQIKPTTAFLLGYAGSVQGLKDCTTNAFFGALHLKRALVSCGGDQACAISRHNRGLRAKPKPASAYNKKVGKNLNKIQAWIK